MTKIIKMTKMTKIIKTTKMIRMSCLVYRLFLITLADNNLLI